MLHLHDEKTTKMMDLGAKVYVRWSIKQTDFYLNNERKIFLKTLSWNIFHLLEREESNALEKQIGIKLSRWEKGKEDNKLVRETKSRNTGMWEFDSMSKLCCVDYPGTQQSGTPLSVDTGHLSVWILESCWAAGLAVEKEEGGSLLW